MNKPELILPGGDLERVKVAFLYGADAVYVGLNKYSLRKTEVRFNIDEIKKAIDHAHSINKRLFVTFNIFAHNEHLGELESDLKRIARFEPDAFIISDPGVISLAQKVAPKVPIHLSTQANTINSESVRFWQKQGIKRIVLARELNLEEIKEIHKAAPTMELEVFVHGAMCISYSGRCLLSNYMIDRKANLGDCAQPCRWNYNILLEEKMRPGEYYPIEEAEGSTGIMSSKDLRLVRYLPEILKAGAVGLKVEGRNKSEYYLATTASTYREALNLIKEKKYTNKEKDRLEKELEKLNYRGYTTGFFFNDAKSGETIGDRKHRKDWEYLGIVSNYSSSEARSPQQNSSRQGSNNNLITVKNKITTGDKVEVLTPEGIFQDKIIKILDVARKEISEINPGRKNQRVNILLSGAYPANSMLRKRG